MPFPLVTLLAGLAVITASPTTRATRSDAFSRFDRVLPLEKTSETSANVSIGDLNGDGKDGYLDVAVARSDAPNAVYFFGSAGRSNDR